jgi:four helix bundle protein
LRELARAVLLRLNMSTQSALQKARTMRFAVDVCRLLRDVPTWEPGATVKHQLTRSATGVAFNYRATCRARSHDEFTAKLGISVEESDESQGWLEFIEAAGLLKTPELTRLIVESAELAAILSAAYGTARHNQRKRRADRAQKTSTAVAG